MLGLQGHATICSLSVLVKKFLCITFRTKIIKDRSFMAEFSVSSEYLVHRGNSDVCGLGVLNKGKCTVLDAVLAATFPCSVPQ